MPIQIGSLKSWLLVVIHAVIYAGFYVYFSLADPYIAKFSAVFASLLIWISVVDFIKYEIPDLAVILLIIVGVAHLWLFAPNLIVIHTLSALIWPLVGLGVAWGYKRFRGVHGLGFGDVKLIAAIALWCGGVATVHVLLAASIAGLVVLLFIAACRRRSLTDIGQSAVAFGPFLCLSTWSIWLSGLTT